MKIEIEVDGTSYHAAVAALGKAWSRLKGSQSCPTCGRAIGRPEGRKRVTAETRQRHDELVRQGAKVLFAESPGIGRRAFRERLRSALVAEGVGVATQRIDELFTELRQRHIEALPISK